MPADSASEINFWIYLEDHQLHTFCSCKQNKPTSKRLRLHNGVCPMSLDSVIENYWQHLPDFLLKECTYIFELYHLLIKYLLNLGSWFLAIFKQKKLTLMLNINTIILFLTDITTFSCCSGVLQCMACELRSYSRMGEMCHWKGRSFFACIFIVQNVK